MNSWHAISLVVALESLAATAGVCGAQTAARLGLDAGATAPVSTYGSDKNVGYHIGLLVDVRVPESPLGFRIDGAFHELKYSGNATKEQIWMANANVLLKAPTGTMVVPYAIGGAGIYSSHRTLFLGTRARTLCIILISSSILWRRAITWRAVRRASACCRSRSAYCSDRRWRGESA